MGFNAKVLASAIVLLLLYIHMFALETDEEILLHKELSLTYIQIFPF